MWELRRALQRNDPVPGTAGRICDIPYDDTGLVWTPKTNLTTSGGRANYSGDKNVQNINRTCVTAEIHAFFRQ